MEEGDNELKVAYNLVLDNHALIKSSQGEIELATSPPPSDRSVAMDIKSPPSRRDTPQEGNEVFTPSSISMLSTSITGGLDLNDEMSRQGQCCCTATFFVVLFEGTTNPAHCLFFLAADKKKMKRSKWHLGIRSRSEPADIMSEVFAALKNLQMEWRVMDSPFHLKVRHLDQVGKPVIYLSLSSFVGFLLPDSQQIHWFFAGDHHAAALQGGRQKLPPGLCEHGQQELDEHV